MVDVTVIIPTYNRRELLRRAIESCFDQKGVKVEVIVIDDGGTDDTEEMIQSLPIPVQYVWKEHEGPGAARNIGMKMARGRYIKFLDSDDLLAKDALVAECIMLDSTGADVSYGKWRRCNEYGEAGEKVHGQYEGDFFNFILQGYWYADFAFLFRTQSLREHNLYWDEDVFYIADFSFILSVASALSHFVYVPLCTGYYRKYPRHDALSKVGNVRRQSYIDILRKQRGKEVDLDAYQDATFDLRQRLLAATI